jgi:rubrerythrin
MNELQPYEGMKPVWVCLVCGHYWYKRGNVPSRCPNHKCRSAKWNHVDEKELLQKRVKELEEENAKLKFHQGKVTTPVVVSETQVVPEIAGGGVVKKKSEAEINENLKKIASGKYDCDEEGNLIPKKVTGWLHPQ